MKSAISPELCQYVKAISKIEHPVLFALRERSEALCGSHMLITPDQGQFIAMLTKIINAKKYLEVGVFTGYSALAITLAMDSPDAKTYALDIDPNTMEIAKEYWGKAKVADKIIPIIGDGVASLENLINDGHSNSFDLAFIDAKKSDYIKYFEHCYKLVKTGGLILIDNIFMLGRVISDTTKASVVAIDQFNHYLAKQNLDYCVTTIADGLTIVRKT